MGCVCRTTVTGECGKGRQSENAAVCRSKWGRWKGVGGGQRDHAPPRTHRTATTGAVAGVAVQSYLNQMGIGYRLEPIEGMVGMEVNGVDGTVREWCFLMSMMQ